jgi:hypothetical protein
VLMESRQQLQLLLCNPLDTLIAMLSDRDLVLLSTSAPAILEKIKIIFMYFKKLEKNHGIANELSHKCAKFQFQIQKILGYTKITNMWIWVCIFQISKFQQILSFFVYSTI